MKPQFFELGLRRLHANEGVLREVHARWKQKTLGQLLSQGCFIWKETA
jgi:hypothetical protein